VTLKPAASGPCPLCGVALAPVCLARAEGDEAPIRLALERLPVLACPAPHRYFVGHAFPVWLLDELVEAKLPEVPAGREKGLLLRRYACRSCGAKLPAEGGMRPFSWTLAWRETPAFEARLEVPFVRCPSCGEEQARSAGELAKLLPAALVHAFKSAAIKATG